MGTRHRNPQADRQLHRGPSVGLNSMPMPMKISRRRVDTSFSGVEYEVSKRQFRVTVEDDLLRLRVGTSAQARPAGPADNRYFYRSISPDISDAQPILTYR